MQTPITIDFGDGIKRRLRYTVAATKRLVEKYGDVKKIFEQPKYEFLPILLEGIVAADKEDINIDWLEANVDLPQLESLVEKFWIAFTGKTIEELVKQAMEAAKNAKNEQGAATETTPTIQ